MGSIDWASAINMIVDFLKHISFGGVSLWFLLQLSIWVPAVWFVLMFLFRALSGGGGGDD